MQIYAASDDHDGTAPRSYLKAVVYAREFHFQMSKSMLNDHTVRRVLIVERSLSCRQVVVVPIRYNHMCAKGVCTVSHEVILWWQILQHLIQGTEPVHLLIMEGARAAYIYEVNRPRASTTAVRLILWIPFLSIHTSGSSFGFWIRMGEPSIAPTMPG